MHINDINISLVKLMKTPPLPARRLDLAALNWTVAGYWPTSWTGRSMELGFALEPEIVPVPARVPGSVQGALLATGGLPNWFEGLKARECEWVENRDWMFSAKLPDDWFATGSRFVLNCGGLDGPGLLVFNRKQMGTFDNAHLPYSFDVTEWIQPSSNELHLIFTTPPRWLGQVGYTSQFKDWKPRFNYSWDWIPRMVQIGPWEPITLTVSEAASFKSFRARADWEIVKKTGRLWVNGGVEGTAANARISLCDGEMILKTETIAIDQLADGFEWRELAVEPWWPNGEGDRPLYSLTCELLDASGYVLDSTERRVGFKNATWQACANAPAEADPWICVINGKPVFLQGIDWTPIRPTFADLRREDFRKLIELYAELGCNIFRVWGGAYLETNDFYELCDEYGILVWQEFPLCSSGHENWPHEDEPSMATLVEIAESFIVRRQHHAALLMWCGGNELQGAMDGNKTGIGKPVGLDHPLMKRWLELVNREDPGRRFVPASSSGPHFMASEKRFGQGEHWDVHGPWKLPGDTVATAEKYWTNDDALFRSEAGVPGTSSAEIIRRYAGGIPTVPGTMANPLWRRFAWWLEWADFIKEKGVEPASLDEYVEWSQARQAAGIGIAVRASKKRFPGIGGIILWMGHDAFPCNANTAIIDFHGQPKPAALAASAVWKTPVGEL